MKHMLPPLPYPIYALEPNIDTRTMIVHHDLHHGNYVKALNLALESAPKSVQTKTAEWLLLNLSEVPEDIRTAVHNNAGGHVNHSLFWKAMSPKGGDSPANELAESIDDAFGSFEKFKHKFEEEGNKLFGSGWVWLVKSQMGEGKLQIMTTSGHDNPLTQGCAPILLNDVWEHAYYLKNENRRSDYLHNWWAVANWKEAEALFEKSMHAAKHPSAVNDEKLLAVAS